MKPVMFILLLAFSTSISAQQRNLMQLPAPDITLEKAYRDFGKRFNNTGEVVWHKVKDGSIVYFTMNGAKVRAGYDRRGKWLYNHLAYAENNLDPAMRRNILSNYVAYNITCVDEIQLHGQVIYFVQVANGSSTVHLRISDGEMESMATYHAATR